MLIIADDFGIDVASFYPTAVRKPTTPPAPPMPNLTALAHQGVLFSRAWANPYCSPTRATILTGRYGFRTGMGFAWGSSRPPLALAEFSLPEAIRAGAGTSYVLASFGKWHLSGGDSDPNKQGWSHYAGARPGSGAVPNYFSWSKTVDGKTTTSKTYATTDTVNEAVSTITQAKASNRPYMLWVAFNAPHGPFHRPPNALHSRDSLPLSGASDRAYFDAMAEAMDTEIGRLLAAVGDLSNTTVIFVGDNGTTASVIASPYPKGKDKGTMYQGGVHVPLLVAGAGVVGSNRISSALVNTIDLFPTILELTGVDPTAVVPSGTKIDGVSMLPYIENREHPQPRGWVFAEQFGNRYDGRWQRAIRDGRYKLIKRWDDTRELYDLSADSLETKNLLQGKLLPAQSQALTRLENRLTALLATR